MLLHLRHLIISDTAMMCLYRRKEEGSDGAALDGIALFDLFLFALLYRVYDYWDQDYVWLHSL
jgi:hypothetical protein